MWWLTLLPFVALVLLVLNQWRLSRLRARGRALLARDACSEPGCGRLAADPVHDWAGGSCCGAHSPLADVEGSGE